MKGKVNKGMRDMFRYIFGVVLVFGGISEFSAKPIFSAFAILFGISLLPALYDFTPLGKRKNLYIIIPVILFIPTVIFFMMYR